MTPPDIPAWLWLALAAVAGWFASEFWPFVRGEWTVRSRIRREQEAIRVRELENRMVEALERFATSQANIERLLDTLDQTLDQFARANIVTSMRLDEIARMLRDNPPGPLKARTVPPGTS